MLEMLERIDVCIPAQRLTRDNDTQAPRLTAAKG